MHRRQFTLGLASWTIGARMAPAVESSRGPKFWRVRQGRSEVFLFGFSDARDRSWYTPSIQAAFERSTALWQEVSPPASAAQVNDLYARHGIDAQRSLLDALPVRTRTRALDYMARLAIERASIEHMRPWRAYYAFVAAYGAQRRDRTTISPDAADGVLLVAAKQAGKTLDYEFAGFDRFVAFMVSLSDRAQAQYLDWLFDYFDADTPETREAGFGWTAGRVGTAEASLERMQALPDLYAAMQVQRNRWWADKIKELLAARTSTFVAVGLLHALGPDGIPSRLRDLGLPLEEL